MVLRLPSLFRTSITTQPRHSFFKAQNGGSIAPITNPLRQFSTSKMSSDRTTGEGATSASGTKPDTTDEQHYPPLPLPAPEDVSATKIDISGGSGTVKLDHLGPLIVNTDGTLSRIANWEQMSEFEKNNTLRVLTKRNKLRIETLQDSGEGAGAEKKD